MFDFLSPNSGGILGSLGSFFGGSTGNQSFDQGRGGQIPAGPIDPAQGKTASGILNSLGGMGEIMGGLSGMFGGGSGSGPQAPQIQAPSRRGIAPTQSGGGVSAQIPNLVGLTPRARNVLQSGILRGQR